MIITEISYVILIILSAILIIYFIRIAINIKIYQKWDSHRQFAKMGGKNGIHGQADTNH